MGFGLHLALENFAGAAPPSGPSPEALGSRSAEPHRLAMVFKLVEAAQKYWRRLDGNCCQNSFSV
jgi:hypothetical protein